MLFNQDTNFKSVIYNCPKNKDKLYFILYIFNSNFNLKLSKLKGIFRKIINQVLKKPKAKGMLNIDVTINRKVTTKKPPESIPEETSKTHFSFLDNKLLF